MDIGLLTNIDDARAQGCRAEPWADPYRPTPDPRTGELKIDPDIELKARKFNLQINFFYSSHSNANAEYGRGRSASVKSFVTS